MDGRIFGYRQRRGYRFAAAHVLVAATIRSAGGKGSGADAPSQGYRVHFALHKKATNTQGCWEGLNKCGIDEQAPEDVVMLLEEHQMAIFGVTAPHSAQTTSLLLEKFECGF